MLTRQAYAYYEAGAAVTAAYYRLRITQVSVNAARGQTEVALPRESLKIRMTMWLAGLAAEKRGVGETDNFRRMKVRGRIREELDTYARGLRGRGETRDAAARALLNQAQDRANAICLGLFEAIRQVAVRLEEVEVVSGEEVERIVAGLRRGMADEARSAIESGE